MEPENSDSELSFDPSEGIVTPIPSSVSWILRTFPLPVAPPVISDVILLRPPMPDNICPVETPPTSQGICEQTVVQVVDELVRRFNPLAVSRTLYRFRNRDAMLADVEVSVVNLIAMDLLST